MATENNQNNNFQTTDEKPSKENWKMILIFATSVAFIIALAIFESQK